MAQTGWLFQASDYPHLLGMNKRSLKQPPRPLHKGCFAAFSLGRVHPSFAKEGNKTAAPSIRPLHPLEPRFHHVFLELIVYRACRLQVGLEEVETVNHE
jgi:hypothetical protein